MDYETLDVLRTAASVGRFLLELCRDAYHLCKRLNAQRMARREERDKASKNS